LGEIAQLFEKVAQTVAKNLHQNSFGKSKEKHQTSLETSKWPQQTMI
jgi:hypothetical protein